MILGDLFERDHNFTPVKIYRKRINVSEINPFPNLPERIGGLEEWLMTCVGLAILSGEKVSQTIISPQTYREE